jgi:hypothetical protein
MTTIRSTKDIPDALVASVQRGGLVVTERDLGPEFFDLRTGFAGELFQKCVNYGAGLAIVIADSKAYGERFSELVYEHRGHAVVRFFGSETDARQWLQTRRS